MPCRPKLCQRLAAQLSHQTSAPGGNNHIWISDELLTEAFHRYVSVSHATRRYGSNVPGPLEARKRAAKRRMGFAAASASMGPAYGGDFGALFGAGAGGSTIESNWSWKPPGTQTTNTQPTTKPPPPSGVWSWASRPPKPPAEWDQYLEMPPSGGDLVEESQAAFEDLLEHAAAFETLDATHVAPLSEFLTSSANETEAKNVSRLVEWLSGRPVSTPAWKAITAMICDKIKLASIDDDELLEVIRALPSVLDWKEAAGDRQRLHEIYSHFSRTLDAQESSRDIAQQAIFDEFHKTTHDLQACTDLVEIFSRTVSNHTSPSNLSKNISVTLLALQDHGGETVKRTELLSQMALTIGHLSSDLIPEVLRLTTRKIMGNSQQARSHTKSRALIWLDCLAQSPDLSTHLPVVYAELARRLRPYHLAEHFGQTYAESVDVARILLRVWLPNTKFEKTPEADHTTDRAASGSREVKRLQYGLRDLTAADLPAIAEDFEHLYATTTRTPQKTWLIFTQAFQRAGVSYGQPFYDLFHVCKARISPKSLYMLSKGLLDHHDLAIPTRPFIQLIEHFLAEGRNDLALKTFQNVPSVSITDVPKLPLILLEDPELKFDMFDLLLRHPESLRFEDRVNFTCNITPGHIEVVHLIAHRIATATAATLTPLQAFRRVWSLYRWLKDRNAPIQPLMSRAFVTAGILRPIKEHLWVPNERFDYILDIVEEVEGLEVRLDVERLASLMRSSVHKEVLAKRSLKKQVVWMRQFNNMDQESRFRLKRWTKHKPVPSADRRTFVVPSEVPDPANIWHPSTQCEREHLQAPVPTEDGQSSIVTSRTAEGTTVRHSANNEAGASYSGKGWTQHKPAPAADTQSFAVASKPPNLKTLSQLFAECEDSEPIAATELQPSREVPDLDLLLRVPAIKTLPRQSAAQEEQSRKKAHQQRIKKELRRSQKTAQLAAEEARASLLTPNLRPKRERLPVRTTEGTPADGQDALGKV